MITYHGEPIRRIQQVGRATLSQPAFYLIETVSRKSCVAQLSSIGADSINEIIKTARHQAGQILEAGK